MHTRNNQPALWRSGHAATLWSGALLLALVIGLLLIAAAGTANATPRYPGYGHVVAPPGNTTFSTVRALAEWVVGGFGHNITSTVEYTRHDGCLQAWRQYWRGPFPVGAPVLVGELCPK